MIPDSHDHPHHDWLGLSLAAVRYAGDRASVRAAYWMTPAAVGLGVLAAWAAWAGGWRADPLVVGCLVAFLVVFATPYVYQCLRCTILKVRGHRPRPGGSTRGHAPPARPADHRR